MTAAARSLSRATVTSAAVLATGLGSAFHAAAGGQLPGPIALTFIALTTWALARWIVGSRPTPRRIAAAVAFGQAFIHVALTATAGHSHAGYAASTEAGSRGGSTTFAPGSLGDALSIDTNALDAATQGTTDPVALAIHRIAEELTLGHSAMALGHALAGVLVGLWIALGHRAFSIVVRLSAIGVTAFVRRWPFLLMLGSAIEATPGGVKLDFVGAVDDPVSAQWHSSPTTMRGPPAPVRPVPNRDALLLAA